MAQHDLLKNNVITLIEFKAIFFDITDIDEAKNVRLTSLS